MDTVSFSPRSSKPSFYKRVRGISLTKKERLVAQHLLDNHSTAGFMSASGIARELGISDVTVIRFARKLGYTGFADLQEALQEEIVEKLEQSSDRVTVPQNRLDKALENADGKSLLQLAVDGLVDNINLLALKNRDEIFERAARILYASRRKIVVGFRGASASARSLATRLAYMLDDVHPVLHSDPSDYSCVYTLNADDCLVAFGFEEYQSTLVTLVKCAQKRGAKVIIVTDKETSPLTFQSDVCIYCSIKGISFNSFASVILANEIIAAHLVKITGTGTEARNKDILDYMRESGYYWNRRDLP